MQHGLSKQKINEIREILKNKSWWWFWADNKYRKDDLGIHYVFNEFKEITHIEFNKRYAIIHIEIQNGRAKLKMNISAFEKFAEILNIET